MSDSKSFDTAAEQNEKFLRKRWEASQAQAAAENQPRSNGGGQGTASASTVSAGVSKNGVTFPGAIMNSRMEGSRNVMIGDMSDTGAQTAGERTRDLGRAFLEEYGSGSGKNAQKSVVSLSSLYQMSPQEWQKQLQYKRGLNGVPMREMEKEISVDRATEAKYRNDDNVLGKSRAGQNGSTLNQVPQEEKKLIQQEKRKQSLNRQEEERTLWEQTDKIKKQYYLAQTEMPGIYENTDRIVARLEDRVWELVQEGNDILKKIAELYEYTPDLNSAVYQYQFHILKHMSDVNRMKQDELNKRIEEIELKAWEKERLGMIGTDEDIARLWDFYGLQLEYMAGAVDDQVYQAAKTAVENRYGDSFEPIMEYLDWKYSQAKGMEKLEKLEAFATKDGWTAAGTSVASVPLKLLSGLGAVDTVWQMFSRNALGKNVPMNGYSPLQLPGKYANTIRNSVSELIEEKSGSGLSVVYEIGMTALDSIATIAVANAGAAAIGKSGTASLRGIAPLLKKKGASAVSSCIAISDAAVSAVERNATDEQILACAAFAGIAEIVANAMPLDRLIGLEHTAQPGKVVQGYLVQSGIEATQAELEYLANCFADLVIMEDKSKVRAAIYEYVDQGYTYEQAEQMAAGDFCLRMVEVFMEDMASVSEGKLASVKQ